MATNAELCVRQGTNMFLDFAPSNINVLHSHEKKNRDVRKLIFKVIIIKCCDMNL